MNVASFNFLNDLKAKSNDGQWLDSWPVREFIVTLKPEGNRAIIDYTRNFDLNKRAFMDRDKDDIHRLYLQGHGFLNEFDVISFFKDGSSKVEPFVK